MKHTKKFDDFVNEKNDKEVNEASIIDGVIITNKLFNRDSNFWVENKFKFADMVNEFIKGSKIKDGGSEILVTIMDRIDNWKKLDEENTK